METTVAPVPDWIRFTIAPALALLGLALLAVATLGRPRPLRHLRWGLGVGRRRLGHAAWGVAAATWALALSGLLPPTARFPC